MQDKILFAAGLVALFIGLFIGVRTDNSSKKIEQELSEARRQAAALTQQVEMEKTKGASFLQQLQTAQQQTVVAKNKVIVSTSWYDKLQDTNKDLAGDIYTIRLALEEVTAALDNGRTGEAADKVKQLMTDLDQRHAAAAGDSAPVEAKGGEETESKATVEEIPGEAAMAIEEQGAEPEEQPADAIKQADPGEKQEKQEKVPESSSTEEQEPAPDEHSGDKAGQEAVEKVQL